MAFTPQEESELRRVLAAFKADLPAHELGAWHVEIEPHRVTVEDGRERAMSSRRAGFGYVKAAARCLRCGMWFGTDSKIQVGSFWVRKEGDHADAVAAAKESLESNAVRAGLCWGGVPQPQREPNGYATLDAVADTREP